jgi:hypothetical protein
MKQSQHNLEHYPSMSEETKENHKTLSQDYVVSTPGFKSGTYKIQIKSVYWQKHLILCLSVELDMSKHGWLYMYVSNICTAKKLLASSNRRKSPDL